MAGAGMYHLAPDQLDRYRQAVADDSTGPALEQLIAGLRKAKVDVYGSDALKTAPKGYPKDHPRVELLRYRGLVATKSGPWRPGSARRPPRPGWSRCSGRPGRCARGSTCTSVPAPMDVVR